MNFQISKTRYGNVTIRAQMNVIFMCIQNCAAISMLIKVIEKSAPSSRYRKKSDLEGARMRLSNRNSLKKKSTTTAAPYTPSILNRLPLSSSK